MCAKTLAMHDERTANIGETSLEMALVPLRLLVLWEGLCIGADLPSTGELKIGRAKHCDLVVEHASVSRVHAAIEIAEGRVLVRDLGSQNGTRVAGRKLGKDETTPLKPGVVVEMGRAVLLLQPRATMKEVHEPADDSPLPPLPGLVVPSEGPMRLVYRLVAHVAASKISVIVLGETGTGKENVAEAMHRWSDRASGPFVRLNCAAVPENLVESELFGHEKGAFTGALTAKPGLIESAHGGTLFLDEVGEMPAAAQVKLLRVLEDRTVQRIGALAPRPIDIRVVSATHRDLEARVREGAFRADLYYRLNGVTLTIPPLRARVQEIPDLAEAFAIRAAQDAKRPPPKIAPHAMAVLRRHTWPGNVRELRNVIERAVVLARGGVIEAEGLLDPNLVGGPSVEHPPAPTLGDQMADIEKARILEALADCRGNQSEAARVLGIPRRTLVRRLRDYGISKKRDD